MQAHVIEIFNPFKALDDTHVAVVSEELTVWDWLQKRYPGFKEFSHPTICIFNGHPLLRAEWRTKVIKDKDVVNFVVVPQEPITIILVITAIVLIAAIVIALTLPTPGQTDFPEPDPVYDLKGQKNQVRLSYPIEVPYGKIRHWPSYAARPYNKYVSNEQWQYSLYCIGQGYYDVHQVYIEDTEIENFQDTVYQIYAPGQQVTLFPDNVVTSVEVANIELFGPNQAEYDGWSGGYAANPANTLSNHIEVDITLPAGLYYANDDGGLDNRTATATFEYRLIDNLGNPLGSWTLLFNFSKTLKTNTPQRFTLEAELPSGRYEVRGQRTNNKDTSHRAGNIIRWDALRAFLPSTKDYGNVTLIAVKARASNNLNDQSQNRVNVSATRKLRKWNKTTQSWTARTATRSIVWAFCDLFQANYGGRLADQYLDLDYLYDLDAIYTARGEFFDYVFDQKSTVWDAAKTICRCGRGIPMLNGSRVTIIRDAPKTLPTAVFNQENIVKDSLKWEIKLAVLDDFDGVEIEYVDPITWKQETVVCKMVDETGDYPEQVKLLGCTDRDHAYHEGMYLRATRRYQRENVTFKTGLEGHIPSYGDLVAVSHDLPRWGTGGLVRAILPGPVLRLSEPVEFESGANHVVVLRKRDGSAAGPYPVTAGVDAYHVNVGTAIGASWNFDSTEEPPLFLFGKTDLWSKLCTVTKIAPSDDGIVELTCVAYDARIHSFDELDAPPLSNPTLPPVIPSLPSVTGFVVQPIVDTIQQVLLSWNPALGAQSYLLQRSSNGTDWETIDRVVTTSYVLSVTPGYLYLRISALNLGAGPWSNWEGEVGTANEIPANVLGLQLQGAFNGTFCKIQWLSVATATSYVVRVFQASDLVTPVRVSEVTDTTFTYSIENAREDSTPERELLFSVTAKNVIGESDTPATLEATNPAPAVLTGLAYTLVSEDASVARYRISWTVSSDVDIEKYNVWGSDVNGFTPGPTNLLFSALASAIEFDVEKDSTGAHDAFYWRVAAIDVWGPEYNASAQQTIPALVP